MRTLVICRPAPDADMAGFASHLPDEARAVADLATAGVVLEAYTIGRPGAVLVLDGDATAARAVVATLPLVSAGLLEVELFELRPML